MFSRTERKIVVRAFHARVPGCLFNFSSQLFAFFRLEWTLQFQRSASTILGWISGKAARTFAPRGASGYRRIGADQFAAKLLRGLDDGSELATCRWIGRQDRRRLASAVNCTSKQQRKDDQGVSGQFHFHDAFSRY